MSILSYPSLNRKIYYLNIDLNELKKYYMNNPSQYILYEISLLKKQIDNLTKNKKILQRKMLRNFFKKYEI